MLRINQNKNIPESVHNKVLILTDLEPDDVLSLRMLRKVIPDTAPVLVIVGEGAVDKTEMANNIMKKYDYRDFHVLQGKKSSKDFPMGALTSYSSGKSVCKPVPSNNSSTGFTINIQLTQFLTCSELISQPVIIALKPLWELLDIDKAILAQCVMFLYGSFNLRTMKFDKSKPCDVSDFINTSFKHVILYESFYATGVNSINKTNAKSVFDNLDAELTLLITAWNIHIASECLETVNRLTIKMDKQFDIPDQSLINWKDLRKDYDRMMNRNLKVVGNIVESDGLQMVLADSGLIGYVFNDIKSGEIVRGNISLDDSGYTQMSQSETGKVYLITKVNFDELVLAMANVGQNP